MSDKITFICRFICIICSLELREHVNFHLNIYKTQEQHSCSEVILPLMGCFCENLRGYVISQLQVVFEWQLDLNSFSW